MILTKIFNFQNKTITSGALILGVSYCFSALLGLFRDRLLAGRFGAGLELDVYFAAFRIPDFVYNILIFGGLIVAFLPLFSEYFAKDKEEAWKMTNYILNALLFFLILFSLLLFFLTPWLIKWIFPGFGPEQQNLAVPLTRLLFLSPILFGISNLLSGILQYFHRFFVYSLTPILYNLGIIFGILFLSPKFGIFGVGMGVILGAFCHMAIQIPSAIKCGLNYKFLFDFKYPAIGRIFKLMIPRVFAVAAQQINLIVIVSIASIISAGSIAIFNFSNNLQGLPIGVIGASFAVAIFPSLSRAWAQNQKEEFARNFSKVFRQVLFLTIPVSILIFIFRNLIVKIILETGQFSAIDTKLTATCLGLFAFSIFAQSLIPLLSRAFFSWQDTKTPTLVTIFSVVLNIVLAFSFIQLLNSPNLFSNFIENSFHVQGIKNISVIGLPLAFSISAIFQFILLFTLFKKKINKISNE
jgi:putative peptidoglycan lipid II flippase